MDGIIYNQILEKVAQSYPFGLKVPGAIPGTAVSIDFTLKIA